jgi:hypothetical protein
MSPLQAFFVGVVSIIAALGVLAAIGAWLDSRPTPKLNLSKEFNDALTEQKSLRTLRNEYLQSLVDLITARFPCSQTRQSWDSNVCTLYVWRIGQHRDIKHFVLAFGETDVTLPADQQKKLVTWLANLRVDWGMDD